mgnify:CR=1 FL=1
MEQIEELWSRLKTATFTRIHSAKAWLTTPNFSPYRIKSNPRCWTIPQILQAKQKLLIKSRLNRATLAWLAPHFGTLAFTRSFKLCKGSILSRLLHQLKYLHRTLRLEKICIKVSSSKLKAFQEQLQLKTAFSSRTWPTFSKFCCQKTCKPKKSMPLTTLRCIFSLQAGLSRITFNSKSVWITSGHPNTCSKIVLIQTNNLMMLWLSQMLRLWHPLSS